MQERTRRPEQLPRKYGPSQVAELTAVRASELGVFLDAETGNTSDDIIPRVPLSRSEAPPHCEYAHTAHEGRTGCPSARD